jgi:hypothetical protein
MKVYLLLKSIVFSFRSSIFSKNGFHYSARGWEGGDLPQKGPLEALGARIGLVGCGRLWGKI